LAYGESTPARGILLSVYMAIGFCSALLLIRREPKGIAALLLVQVLYKVTTPLTVGSVVNPVVVSNLIVAFVHTVTLICLRFGGALGGSLTTGQQCEAKTLTSECSA